MSAEAILVYIIKCKILVSDQTWQKCVEAIIPCLSILLCFATKETPIGRTIFGILDPDIGKSLFLTNVEVVFVFGLLYSIIICIFLGLKRKH